MKVSAVERGILPPDPVAPDSLPQLKRQQTNPSRWNGATWPAFVTQLEASGVRVFQDRGTCATFVTDAGGLSFGMPHGVVTARSALEISAILRAAQTHRVPVTTRGGGLTTEGETVAYGGLLLDMTGLSRVLHVDRERLLVRTQENLVLLTVPPAALKPGSYRVTLVGKNSSRTWTLQVH